MIEDLYRYVEIYETGSITKAARKTHLTQPALSLVLKKLEKELKTKLIIRTNKTFSITNDGKSVYYMAKKIIQIWEGMKNPKKRSENKKTYTVGLFDNAAIKLAQNTKFLEGEDYITEVIIDNSSNLQKLLSQGVIDVCICVLDLKNQFVDNSVSIKEYNEELIPVSSKKFNLPISKIPFILYNNSSHTRSYIDQTFLKQKTEPFILAQSTSTTFLKELALLGKGVALLPKISVAQELKTRQLINQNFAFKFTRRVGIFLSKNSNLHLESPFIKLILETILQN